MDNQQLLADQRQKISAIDSKIVELLASRKMEVLKIKEIKAQLALEIHDPNREKIMKEKRQQLAEKHHLEPQLLEDLYQIILNWSRKIQKEQK